METELKQAEKGVDSFKVWKQDLATLADGIDRPEEIELRLKVRSHLQGFIERIEVFAIGYPDTDESPPQPTKGKGRRSPQRADDFTERMEAIASEYYPNALDSPEFMEFVQFVAERRKTKAGRFIRVHFRSNSFVDLVPNGSLADGMEMCKDNRKRVGWRFVKPNLNRLWRDFRTAQKQLKVSR